MRHGFSQSFRSNLDLDLECVNRLDQTCGQCAWNPANNEWRGWVKDAVRLFRYGCLRSFSHGSMREYICGYFLLKDYWGKIITKDFEVYFLLRWIKSEKMYNCIILNLTNQTLINRINWPNLNKSIPRWLLNLKLTIVNLFHLCLDVF